MGFSGLPCKSYIAHTVHIAWTRGRVEVQRVGGHIAHIAHIAWSWGRVEVHKGVILQRVAQLCVFGQG